MSDILLDTCALLWLANGEDMKQSARKAVIERNIHVSPISAWEIANLAHKNRVSVAMPVATWFMTATDRMSAEMPPLSVDILTQSCALPGSPPNDPADRIIIATARQADLAIVTRDAAILAYSREGHVRTLEC